MVGDVVRNVAGNHLEVGVIMGEGSDPHLFENTPAVARDLDGAKIVFASGLHLEGKLTDLLRSMGRKKPVYFLGEKIDQSQVLDDPRGTHDPHIWFDVNLWSQTTDVVRDALSEYDPAHKDDYWANAKDYKQRLEKLHKYAEDEIATIPKERRVLVTAHDAFHYFGRAYHMKVRGVQGISTEDEAGVLAIRDLVRFITTQKIKAVFVESSVSEKNLQALREGCKEAGHPVKIGGMLYSDAMGKDGTPEGTYEGMVRHNVKTIVSALK
jgi:manganese/zinc/iron transport system substrate-binding protein